MITRAVPYDGVCVLTMDPATLMPTGEVVEHGLPPAAMARMAEIELRGVNVNSFGALVRSRQVAPWTVQDHFKAIFEKVGVGTRGELVARLVFDHYAPRLTDHLPAVA